MLEQMSEISRKLPEYDNPPVSEVVSGIQFKPIKGLTAAYVGLLWESFKPDYPQSKEVAPLMPAIESFDETPAREMASFENFFGLTRTWFETSDGNGLIQVQRDRLLHNWRKEKATDKYPHYDYVIDKFRAALAKFEEFLKRNNLDPVEPLQFELTYVNHIPQDEGWHDLNELGEVLPDFSWRPKPDRFLPHPETINWQATFLMPERSGRLHQSIRLAKRRTDGRPTLVLELTARGIGDDKSRSAMWDWFNLAHEWIVLGFTDMTGESVQKAVWKRKR